MPDGCVRYGFFYDFGHVLFSNYVFHFIFMPIAGGRGDPQLGFGGGIDPHAAAASAFLIGGTVLRFASIAGSGSELFDYFYA